MVCPFVDAGEERCAESFTLDKIDFAVAVCGNDFTVCKLFWELMSRVHDESETARKSVA